MTAVNPYYANLQGSYLFSEVRRKRLEFEQAHPEADLVNLGLGDVTLGLAPAVIAAMHKATDELANPATFRGYGPEPGYDFLVDAIIKHDFLPLGVKLERDEVFVSDGSKCDVGNFQEIFAHGVILAVQDPVYPVYVDSNVMAGRSGLFSDLTNQYERIVYMPGTAENHFTPALPTEKVDLIYLCYPNNPTGETLTRDELKVWVDYAREHDAIILFDAAYEAFITESDVPHSIYEIEGAREVAVEFRSYSKTAGFTGVRCAYVVVPRELYGRGPDGSKVNLGQLWNRRQSTKFNGVSYITQRGAEAIYSPEGKQQVADAIAYYLHNARTILDGLHGIGMEAYGGINSPYVWLRTPGGMDSWAFFEKLLAEAHILGTPGVGFGQSGQGYFRLTGFGTQEETAKAVERMKNLKL